jgi:nitrate reductase cytochrome c-type subunit
MKLYPFMLIFVSLILLACRREIIDTLEGEQGAERYSLLATGSPGMNRWIEVEPGESSVLPRAYELAPPLVPHSVKDFTINIEQNDCLDCHAEGIEIDVGHIATKIPDTHYEDGEISGMRYNCLQCHVPQADIDD